MTTETRRQPGCAPASTKEEQKERERRRQQRARDIAYKADADHRVISFREWCALNGFSQATGRRILKAGSGPVITQLSERRLGVTISNNRVAGFASCIMKRAMLTRRSWGIVYGPDNAIVGAPMWHAGAAAWTLRGCLGSVASRHASNGVAVHSPRTAS